MANLNFISGIFYKYGGAINAFMIVSSFAFLLAIFLFRILVKFSKKFKSLITVEAYLSKDCEKKSQKPTDKKDENIEANLNAESISFIATDRNGRKFPLGQVSSV